MPTSSVTVTATAAPTPTPITAMTPGSVAPSDPSSAQTATHPAAASPAAACALVVVASGAALGGGAKCLGLRHPTPVRRERRSLLRRGRRGRWGRLLSPRPRLPKHVVSPRRQHSQLLRHGSARVGARGLGWASLAHGPRRNWRHPRLDKLNHKSIRNWNYHGRPLPTRTARCATLVAFRARNEKPASCVWRHICRINDTLTSTRIVSLFWWYAGLREVRRKARPARWGG
mmetsp:Transcript_25117/g.57059  ORF Transcript_25117/g.57059 Transcript_25117/m.57059 type:complete len:230 (+) Transcript_25117:716-1405(+)